MSKPLRLPDLKKVNIRKIFVPQPGNYLLDCDLAGADAQVVAWEADDEDLKEAFRQGLKLHAKNCTDVYGDILRGRDPKHVYYEDNPLHYTYYDLNKRMVHGSNYGGSARGIALNIRTSTRFVEDFQRRWFSLHPGIRNIWHQRTLDQLRNNMTVYNRFGYSITFFDRPDNLLPRALAWTPQSTVALVCFLGAINLRRELPTELKIRLQVHDSLILEVPKSRLRELLPQIRELLHVPVPYPDPLIIPWSLSLSDKSWGECEKRSWNIEEW